MRIPINQAGVETTQAFEHCSVGKTLVANSDSKGPLMGFEGGLFHAKRLKHCELIYRTSLMA
jgi:hypothetical protein